MIAKQAEILRKLRSAIYQLDYESQSNRHVVCFYREAFGAPKLLIAGSYVYWGTVPPQIYP